MPIMFRPAAIISCSAADLISREVELHHPLETGGLLLGYWVQRTQIYITDIVTAGPGAKRSRESFLPDTKWQRVELGRIYEMSGRRVTYLGDWHSHPNGRAIPSLQDKETAKTISNYDEARCPHPLIVIAADDDKGFTLASYVWIKNRLNVCRLKMTAGD